jgi:hypothetical protein
MAGTKDIVSARISGPVEAARGLSLADFSRAYHNVHGCRPVVFPGLLGELAERRGDAWTDANLKAKMGDAEVSVYVSADGAFPGGKGPWDAATHRMVKMRFGEGLERMQGQGGHPPILAPGEKYYVYNSSARNYGALLAGLDLKDPMYVLAERRDTAMITRNLWFSEAGSLTPPHHDFSDNFLAQVRGRKRVLLWSPAQSALLYINPIGERHDRMAAVDIRSPDLRVHPRFDEARALECYLDPGDVVFIPAGWIHCVVSLELSISVNFWWRSAQRGGFLNTNEKVLALQYLLRLYPLRPELRALVTYHLREGAARRADRARSWIAARARA